MAALMIMTMVAVIISIPTTTTNLAEEVVEATMMYNHTGMAAAVHIPTAVNLSLNVSVNLSARNS
jgi:hypothetical protein